LGFGLWVLSFVLFCFGFCFVLMTHDYW
jgi:hypothetical protein